MKEEIEESSSSTVIKDALIAPYFIEKDSHCYTICKEFVAQELKEGEKRRGRKSTKEKVENEEPKVYYKTYGHFTNFGNCLSKLSVMLADEKGSYSSLQEYITQFQTIEKNLQILNR
jgi:hypothetical protein